MSSEPGGPSSSSSRARRLDSARRLLLSGALVALSLAGPVPASADGWPAAEWPGEATQGPLAVFETVEAAVMDALAHAHHHADLRDRGRFRVGTVYRIAGGFRYTPAVRSRQTVWATAAPVVRYALRTADVASYVIHPRSGRSEVDRLNERPSSAERRIVDDLDPRGRPLYLLTPSRRVVRYVGGQEARIPAIAVFGHGLPDCDESGSAIGSVASPAP